jgi:hypothetical protein
MPSGKNWINFIYINLAFAAYIAGTFYLNSLQNIKANWPQYRCNPIYMPLSDNIETDFAYCIQNMQSNFMGYLLQPITFLTSSLTSVVSSFTSEVNSVRAMFNKIRTFISSIIQSVFGVFLNLIIEFQKIIIGLKDLMGKTIGIMTTLMYIIDGSIMTMNSSWNGPAGQMVRALGKCFHPDTLVELKNGTIVAMKDLHLGDVLKNGSIVESTMKIDNKKDKLPLYVIQNKETDDNIIQKQSKDIYVTGSHLVYDKNLKQFIRVEKYSNAIKSSVETDWFCCLITSDHKIKIGNETFWDWEDHLVCRLLYDDNLSI